MAIYLISGNGLNLVFNAKPYASKDKDAAAIVEAKKLLNNNQDYSRVASTPNPYGDGKSAKRIVKIIEGFFSKWSRKKRM